MVRLGDIVTDLAGNVEPVIRANTTQIAICLEERGFLKSVAGEEAFGKAVEAFALSFDCDRGLLVTGQNGCGKTQYMRALFRSFITRQKTWLSCNDENDIAYIRECGIYLFDSHLFLDDFGAEMMAYGKDDTVGQFLCRWFERHALNRKLYITTNLTGAQIDERCGGRVFDRLRESCVIFPMQGGSKRKEIVVK